MAIATSVLRRRGASAAARIPQRENRSWFKSPSASAGVDALELPVGPFHGVLGRHALHRLGVHVGDEVLAQTFGRLAIGGTGIARELAGARRRLEWQHRRIFVPERIALPYGRRTDRIAL